jgi:uncharacterized protein (TIGR00369 family)
MTETQLAAAEHADDPTARRRTYTWEDPRVAPAELAGMTGLDMFAAMREGRLPRPPIMYTMDMSAVEVTGDGAVRVSLTPQEFHYNPLGSVHGGVIATLLDTAAACAVHTTLPAGMTYTSLDLTTKFLRAVTVESGTLRCEGTVTHRGRQIALSEAHLYDGAGRLVAHATSSCLIFPIPGNGRTG